MADIMDEEDMDTSDTAFYWFYMAECNGWHRVEDMTSFSFSIADLEKYYEQNPCGMVTTAEGLFQINFAASLLINYITRQTWHIKRSCQNGCRCKLDDIPSSLPTHWKNVDPKQPYQIIPLKSNTDEYRKVETFVRTVGLLQNYITSISRIQNMDLWDMFCRKRTQLMRVKGTSYIEEQMLFHGTSEENLHSICMFNFNCRMADTGRTAHIYGKGTYFAKHASYAAIYSISNGQGIKMILLSRVIVGKYRNGKNQYCSPNDDKNKYKYDSCVDDKFNPSVTVIFDSNQIYPEYVLTFHHN